MRKYIEVKVDNTDVITLIRPPVSDITFFICDWSFGTPQFLCEGRLPLSDYIANGNKIFVSSYIDTDRKFSVRLLYEYELDESDQTDIEMEVSSTMKITDDRKPLKKYSEIECGSVFSFMAGKLIYAIKTDLDAGQDAPVAVDLATGKHRLLSPHTTVSVVDDAELILK